MNASKRYLAMASSLGMHQGTISPSRRRGGCVRRACCPQGRSWGAGLSGGGGTELRGSWRSFGTERAASAGRSCGAEGRSGGRPNCGAPGRCGGKRWRVGIPARGSRASPNDELSAPAQRTAAHATAPKAKEGERTARLPLLFCLRLEWPKDLRGNKAPAFGILLGWGFRVRRDCAPRPIR